MRNHTLRAAAFAAAASLSLALAPEARAQRSGPEVAVIDLSHVFKNYQKFQVLSKRLEDEVKQAEAELKANRAKLQQMARQLDEFEKGSAEYRELEEELARGQADLQIQVNAQKRRFVEQEAANYYSVYQEVLVEVEAFCKQHDIKLVLRYSGQPIDESEPSEVVQALNKSVVYHDPAIDISEHILERLNGRQQVTNRPKQGVPKKTR
jgi:Skp family chaperone for outer membrane proteins